MLVRHYGFDVAPIGHGMDAFDCNLLAGDWGYEVGIEEGEEFTMGGIDLCETLADVEYISAQYFFHRIWG